MAVVTLLRARIKARRLVCYCSVYLLHFLRTAGAYSLWVGAYSLRGGVAGPLLTRRSAFSAVDALLPPSDGVRYAAPTSTVPCDVISNNNRQSGWHGTPAAIRQWLLLLLRLLIIAYNIRKKSFNPLETVTNRTAPAIATTPQGGYSPSRYTVGAQHDAATTAWTIIWRDLRTTSLRALFFCRY